METKLFKECDSWEDTSGNSNDLSFTLQKNAKSKKNKKSKKRKHEEIAEEDHEAGKWVRAPKYYGLEESDEPEESPSKKRKERKRKKESLDDEMEVIPEKKKKKEHIVHTPSSDQQQKSKVLSYEEKLRESLKGSRFRYINEQLYSNPSAEAMKIFNDDKTAFFAYHEGYRLQVTKWPMNPLERLIKQINKM